MNFVKQQPRQPSYPELRPSFRPGLVLTDEYPELTAPSQPDPLSVSMMTMPRVTLLLAAFAGLMLGAAVGTCFGAAVTWKLSASAARPTVQQSYRAPVLR